MNMKKMAGAFFAAFVSVLLLMTMLVGCTGKDTATASAEPSEVASQTGRQDGERFEEVIILEGSEETVKYEHVKNKTAGFELDYEYELLERFSQSDRERFVSRYDDPKNPDNYFEVAYKSENADTVAVAVKADLSKAFSTVVTDSYNSDRVGSCSRISASDAKGGKKAPEYSLQTVYVIPKGDGCLVATAHYTVESAEGFGASFSYMLNTLSVIDK